MIDDLVRDHYIIKSADCQNLFYGRIKRRKEDEGNFLADIVCGNRLLLLPVQHGHENTGWRPSPLSVTARIGFSRTGRNKLPAEKTRRPAPPKKDKHVLLIADFFRMQLFFNKF